VPRKNSLNNDDLNEILLDVFNTCQKLLGKLFILGKTQRLKCETSDCKARGWRFIEKHGEPVSACHT